MSDKLPCLFDGTPLEYRFPLCMCSAFSYDYGAHNELFSLLPVKNPRILFHQYTFSQTQQHRSVQLLNGITRSNSVPIRLDVSRPLRFEDVPIGEFPDPRIYAYYDVIIAWNSGLDLDCLELAGKHKTLIITDRHLYFDRDWTPATYAWSEVPPPYDVDGDYSVSPTSLGSWVFAPLHACVTVRHNVREEVGYPTKIPMFIPQ